VRKPADEVDDFFLTVAEQWLSRRGPDSLDLETFHDFGGHTVSSPDFAGMHAVNTLHEEISGGLLKDDTARAEAQCANKSFPKGNILQWNENYSTWLGVANDRQITCR